MSLLDFAIDIMALAGLALFAWAVFMLAGMPGLVGYLGGLLFAAAVVLAMKRARDEDGDL